MRRTIFAAALLALGWAGSAQAQALGGVPGIWYGPPALLPIGTSSFALPGTAGSFYLYNVGGPGVALYERGGFIWTSNSFRVVTEAGGGGTSRDMVLQPAGLVKVNTNGVPFATDNYTWGSNGALWKSIGVARGLEGSKSMTLPDNTKTAFETVDVAAASYGGGDLIWTLYCADANDRVSRSGRLPFAFQNTGGTETCAVGTTSATADVTNNAKAFTTVTFTCADGGTNKIQIEVLADCTIAAPTTLTIEYRNDMPKINTVTPGT